MGKSGSGNDWMLFNKSTFPSLISLRINSPNSVFCRVDLVQVKLFELFLFFSLEHQFYFYREMVRGRAGLISFDVDFFRTVRCVLLAPVSSDTAIRVCQHTISFYFENRRDEYMVDAAFRETVRIEIIECSVGCIAEVTLFIRVAKHTFADKSVIRLMSLVNVEVAGQDSRKLFPPRAQKKKPTMSETIRN